MPRSARRLTLLAGFTAALLLTSSMTPVARAIAQPRVAAQSAAEFDAFHSKYKFCDAFILMQLWKLDDVAEAKMRIGRELLAHHEGAVEAALNAARAKRFLCPYGFNLDDAARVAALWTTPAGE